MDGVVKAKDQKRLRIHIQGAVQGVGFRPFIFRLAEQHRLTGWVRNNSHGVQIEVEGSRGNLKDFLCAVQNEAPPMAQPRLGSKKRTFASGGNSN